MSGFLNSSIARDDVFVFSDSGLTGSTLLLDVLGNDGGGKAKRLVSLDADRPLDLLTQDAQVQGISAWEPAAYGSLIRIVNGRVELDLSPLLAAQGFADIAALGAGDQLTETFVYALRVGNGTLSHAHVTVTLTGENDIATITGDSAATLRETDAAATGTLTITDPDRGESKAMAVTDAASDNGYGTWSVTEDGTWSFTLDPAAVAHLGSGDVVTDSFVVQSVDGSAAQVVTITIEGEDDALPDTTAPVLVNLTLNASVFDVSTAPGSIQVRIEATDDRIGFEPVLASTGNGSMILRSVDHPNSPLGRGSLPLTSGTVVDGVFEFELPIGENWPGGVYEIYISLLDSAYNTVYYNPWDLAALGLPSQIEILSTPLNDSTAPMLTGFTLGATVFDLADGPATLSVTITATDDLAGFINNGSFGNGSIALRTAEGGYLTGSGSLTQTQGSTTDAVFDLVFNLSETVAPCTYDVGLYLIDRVGNTAFYDADALALLGFDSSVTIVNDAWLG